MKKIKAKRINKEIPLPEYKTSGAVAFDFIVRESCAIKPKSIGYVPLNMCIKPPKGFMLLMTARSSLHKRGLMLANGIALFDQDFCGDEDEYKVVLYNFTNKIAKIEKGDRLTQGVLVPIRICQFCEVEKMNEKKRGGFGSTGRK